MAPSLVPLTGNSARLPSGGLGLGKTAPPASLAPFRGLGPLAGGLWVRTNRRFVLFRSFPRPLAGKMVPSGTRVPMVPLLPSPPLGDMVPSPPLGDMVPSPPLGDSALAGNHVPTRDSAVLRGNMKNGKIENSSLQNIKI